MKIVPLLLVFLASSCFARQDYDFRWQFQRREKISCEQDRPSCKKCLQQESCSWCGVKLCIVTNECPLALQQSSCLNQQDPLLVQQLEKVVKESYQETSAVLDVPQVTVNVTSFCHLKRNCSVCTDLEFCAWCSKNKVCIPYSGEFTTNKLCGSKLWFQNQCVYTGAKKAAPQFKPCPMRTSGCKECLVGKTCYWCDSTKYCGYYRGDAFEPKNCTTGHWRYKSCSDSKAIIVLIPILAIIFTPFIAYIVVYCLLCVMKEAGYDALNDSDSSDDEDKRRKPIMLRHDSPGGKTDKLRRKYNLDNKP